MKIHASAALLAAALLAAIPAAHSEVPPSTSELAAYKGLHKSAASGDLAALQSAIATGADVNARDAKGRTALHAAAYQKQRRAMRALAKAGADRSIADKNSVTPLDHARQRGSAAIVKMLEE
jgi:uncharacterized protein